MTDCATKRIWLAQAENALHEVMTGNKSVKLNFGPGKGVEYSQVNVRDLQTYVNQLRAEVAECDGNAPCRRGPIRVVF